MLNAQCSMGGKLERLVLCSFTGAWCLFAEVWRFVFEDLPGVFHTADRMKSMTGYGRGDCSQDGFKITVEVSSVNRKQSEISVNLPRQMEMPEAQMRDLINQYVARGRLTVRVGLHTGASKLSARMHLNVPLAKAYARELN